MTRSRAATTIAPTAREVISLARRGLAGIGLSLIARLRPGTPQKRFNGTAAPRMRSNVKPNSSRTMNSLVTRTRFRRDHRWTPNHLSDFLDGDLPPRGRRRLERHVGICPECYRALVTLQRMLDRLHQLARPQARVDPDIVSGVRRRLNEQAED